jgi:hypothetical protein
MHKTTDYANRVASATTLRAELDARGARNLTPAEKALMAELSPGFSGKDMSDAEILDIIIPIMHLWIRGESTMFVVVCSILKRLGLLDAAMKRMTAPRTRTLQENGDFIEGGIGLRCKQEVRPRYISDSGTQSVCVSLGCFV